MFKKWYLPYFNLTFHRITIFIFFLKVCVSDIQKEKGEKFMVEQQKKFGIDKIKFTVCDVTKEEDFESKKCELLWGISSVKTLLYHTRIFAN